MAAERKTSKSLKKPAKLKDLASAGARKAADVRGGKRRDKIATNHNQTLRAR